MSFDYDSKISKAVQQVPPSAIRKFFDLANEMKGHVISLSIGEPDFVTPWSIREAAINSIIDGYTHYSPKAQVIVVCGDKENRTEYICNCLNNNSNCGVLTYCGGNYDNADYVIDAGVNMHDYAKSLFYNLRMFDEKNIKTVYAEFDDDTGIGYAVKNRLFKSAGFNVVYV